MSCSRTCLWFCWLLAFSVTSQGALVGISGGWDFTNGVGLDSVLYEIDPVTATVTRTLGSTGIPHVTGIALHPTTGVLYAHANNAGNDAGSLWTINPTTLNSTQIGPTHHSSADLAFRSDGTLYGWKGFPELGFGNDVHRLVTYDLQTGTATQISTSDFLINQVGLAVNQNDTLYLKSRDQLHTLNPTTGAVELTVSLSRQGSISVLAFDGNLAYTIERRSGSSFLQTINPTTGAVTEIGNLGSIPFTALMFTPSSFTTGVTAVPEPGSWFATCVFLVGIGLVRQRRKSAAT